MIRAILITGLLTQAMVPPLPATIINVPVE
jgi:hypothetical protein